MEIVSYEHLKIAIDSLAPELLALMYTGKASQLDITTTKIW